MLVLGLPLLAVSFWLALNESLRGRLLLAGTLGFILYTYITMSFGAMYNQYFLVYVAIFSLSLFAFILTMMFFDLKSLPGKFSESLPRRWIAGLLFFTAAFLSLAWLGRIIPTLIGDQVPVLENTTSMFIQVMDFGIVVPVCVLAGVLLLRREARGYLLASVALMKFLTIALANLVMVVLLLRNIKTDVTSAQVN